VPRSETVAALALIFALLLCRTAPGQELRVSGNRAVPTSDVLREAAAVEQGADSLSAEAFCESLAAFYWDRSFLSAELHCRRRAGNPDTVFIEIEEGPVHVLRFVRVAGSEEFPPSDLQDVFEDDLGRPFARGLLEKGIAEILQAYDRAGYPVTSVEPDLVSRGEGWVGVGLTVREGPKALLGRVDFEGRTGTRKDILLREAGLAPGKPFDGEALDESRRRLLALGIFENISPPRLLMDMADTTVAVVFEVREARTSYFEGLAAWSPSSEDRRFIGSVDLGFGNLAGTLRSLEIVWNRPGDDRLRWSVEYREPRILGRPFALSGRLEADVIESDFARRKLSGLVTYRGEPGFELGLGGLLGSVKDRSGGDTNGDFSERGLSFEVMVDRRDNPSNPRRGWRWRASGEVSDLSFDDPAIGDRGLTTIRTLAEHLLPLGEHYAVYGGVRYGGAFAADDSVPSSHLIRVGGMSSLRGYPEEWFTVRQALVASLEARVLLGVRSRMYGFFDGATLEGSGLSMWRGRLHFGYGLGLAGESGGGQIRLEIALGRGDDWSEAKLHLALLRRF
jgi:outer membrane protein assembly factor BamA